MRGLVSHVRFNGYLCLYNRGGHARRPDFFFIFFSLTVYLHIARLASFTMLEQLAYISIFAPRLTA